MICSTPTYDPFAVVRAAGCPLSMYTTTDPLERAFQMKRTTVSAMFKHCFAPCTTFTYEKVWDDTTNVYIVAMALAVLLNAKLVSRSRWAWIGLASCVAVVGSFMIASYLFVSRSDAKTHMMWMGGMALMASLQAYAAYATHAMVTEHPSWVGTYVGTVATLGFALAKAYLPTSIPATWSDVSYTLLVASSAYAFATHVHPCVTCSAALTVVLVSCVIWMDAREMVDDVPIQPMYAVLMPERDHEVLRGLVRREKSRRRKRSKSSELRDIKETQ